MGAWTATELDGTTGGNNVGSWVSCRGPDGLIYVAARDESEDFYRVEVDGSTTQLAEQPEEVVALTAGPAGFLVFVGPTATYEYDIGDDSFDDGSNRVAIPNTTTEAAWGRIGDKLWVIGGQGGSDVQSYDVDADTWAIEVFSTPGGAIAGNVIAFGDEVYVISTDTGDWYPWWFTPGALDYTNTFAGPPSSPSSGVNASAAPYGGSGAVVLDDDHSAWVLTLPAQTWAEYEIDGLEPNYSGGLLARSAHSFYAFSTVGFHEAWRIGSGGVGPYAYGRQAYGAGRYGGDHPRVLVPSVSRSGLPFLVGNDRYTVVYAVEKGSPGTRPLFRLWTAQPPAWGEALAVQDRSQVVPFFAMNERRRPVRGVLECHAAGIEKGQEATVDGIIVRFICRPSGLLTFDGGLDLNAGLGFTVSVWGYGQPDIDQDDPFGRQLRVVSSPELDFEIPARNISDVRWPNEFSAYLPTLVDTRVMDLRVRFTNVRHVQIEEWGLVGKIHPSRFS